MSDEAAANYFDSHEGKRLLAFFANEGDENDVLRRGLTVQQVKSAIALAEHASAAQFAAEKAAAAAEKAAEATKTTTTTTTTQEAATPTEMTATMTYLEATQQGTQQQQPAQQEAAAAENDEAPLTMATLAPAVVLACGLATNELPYLPQDGRRVTPGGLFVYVCRYAWRTAQALLNHEEPFVKAVFAVAKTVTVCSVPGCKSVAIVEARLVPGTGGEVEVKFVSAVVPAVNFDDDAPADTADEVIAQGTRAELNRILRPGWREQTAFGSTKGQLIMEAVGVLAENAALAPEGLHMPLASFVASAGAAVQWATVRFGENAGTIAERLQFMRTMRRRFGSFCVRLSGRSIRVYDTEGWTFEKKTAIEQMGVRVFVDGRPASNQHQAASVGTLDAARLQKEAAAAEAAALLAAAKPDEDLRVLSSPAGVANETLLERLRRVGLKIGGVVQVFPLLAAAVVRVVAGPVAIPGDDVVQVGNDLALTRRMPLRA